MLNYPSLENRAVKPQSLDMITTLIGFDTVSRNSNLELIHYVRDYLAEHGIQSHLVTNEEKTKANLFATVGPNVEGGIVLSGHTDVVPVEGQPWDNDSFTVAQKAGRLYGVRRRDCTGQEVAGRVDPGGRRT